MRRQEFYLIMGAVLVASSINPISLELYSQNEVAKNSFDMLLVWGSALIGIYLAELMYSRGGELARRVLSFNYTTKGLFFSWVVAGSLLTYWYLPGPFDYSVLSTEGHLLEVLSFIIAGLMGGLGWQGMSNVWRSVTLFSIFSMMATMAEIFLELGGYYSQNLYSVYPVSQFVDTAYVWFAMAFVPSTFYMVKILRDLGIF